MFKKETRDRGGNEKEDAEELRDTIIAQGVKVEGDFKSKGNLIIEGTVLGSVKTNSDLTVGERAVIAASVMANNAFISGEIHGNVKVNERLELAPTAKIAGDVETKILIIMAGALLNGKCSMPGMEEHREKSKKSLKQQEDVQAKDS